MNSNNSQQFGFQTIAQGDKQGSLKIKLANLEVSTPKAKLTPAVGPDQGNH